MIPWRCCTRDADPVPLRHRTFSARASIHKSTEIIDASGQHLGEVPNRTDVGEPSIYNIIAGSKRLSPPALYTQRGIRMAYRIPVEALRHTGLTARHSGMSSHAPISVAAGKRMERRPGPGAQISYAKAKRRSLWRRLQHTQAIEAVSR
jgi:hypothetical protein